MTYLPAVVDVQTCAERLALIFPREGFDSTLSNPLAAASVAALLYLGAVENADSEPSQWRYARPSMVMWLNDETLAHDSATDRNAWYTAAAGGNPKRTVTTLLEGWGLPFNPRYADNTRETLRDETWPAWQNYGAMRSKAGLPTSSSVPRWTLARSFADLFAPDLDDEEAAARVDAWTSTHMSTSGRAKAFAAREAAKVEHAVTVTLPNGTTRQLEPGGASRILRGVIEEWAPRKLAQPLVLSISEPGDKVYLADGAQLAALGIEIDLTNLLPDALLIDTGGADTDFWIIEAVYSDGEINEPRKKLLLAWAAKQGIPAERCQFLTAFESRNAGPARRRLKDLADGTYAWFLAEPDQELLWRTIEPTTTTSPLASVTPISAARSNDGNPSPTPTTEKRRATTGLRTELISGTSSDSAGFGAGHGSTERYEYFCPCGKGKVIEEHDNVPGFREHDVWIDCDKCRTEWRFVSNRSTRQWGLEPVITDTPA